MYREVIFPIWSKEGIEQGQFGEGKGGKSLPSASIFDTFDKATVPNKPLDGQIPCLLCLEPFPPRKASEPAAFLAGD